MIRAAVFNLTGTRTAPLDYVIEFRGLDLTDATLAAQVRMYADQPGDPKIDIPGVTDAGVTGARLISVETVDGLVRSRVGLFVTQDDMATVPLGAEYTDTVKWAWDFQVTPAGGVKAIYLAGKFLVGGGVTLTDPTASGSGFGYDALVTVTDQSVVVELVGADVLTELTDAARGYRDEAEEFAGEAGDSAEAAAASEATAAAYATANVVGTTYADTTEGLAATSDGETFWVRDGTGGVLARLYLNDGGSAELVGFLPMPAQDIVGRDITPLRYNRQAPPGLRIHRDLLALLAGTSNQFGILHVGDSLSDTSWETCGTQVQRNIAEWMPTAPVYAVSGSNILGYTAPTGISLSAGTIYPISGKYTGTYHEKTRYDLTFDGTCMELASGQYAIFAYGGQTLYGDYLLIPLITGPSGGIVRVRYTTAATPVAGSSWLDPTAPQIASSHTLTGGQLLVDTYSASAGLTMVRLNLGAFSALGVRLDHSSGGNVFSLKCQTAVKLASSIPTYRLSTASNDFMNADADCVPIMGGLIAELNYPIIWVASDDTVDPASPSTSDGTEAYANFLPILEAAISASGLTYPPQVVLEGNPYLSNGADRTDAKVGARIDYCWDWCQSRVGWDVLDLMALTGGLAPTIAAGLNGDASPWIHYTGTLARIGADTWWQARGYDAPAGRRPGGDATTGQILLGGSTNLVNAETVMDALAAPSRFDTGYLTWSSTATSGGSMTTHTANTGMRLATSTTAGGAIRAFFNVAQSPLGKDQGNIRGDVRRVGFRVRLVTTSADANFYALMRSGGSYNSAAAGALTASGYGFRVINGTIVGTCWGNLTGTSTTATLVLSTDSGVAQNGGSVTMVTGGAADYVDCLIRLFSAEVNASRGRIQWWVNGVIIGEAAYDHSGTYLWGYELLSTNGATTSFTADVSYPIFVTGGGTAS